MKFNQTLLVFSTLVLGAFAPAPRVLRFLGPRAADTLAGATRVEVFEVKNKRANEGQPALGGYVVDATGEEQGEAFARKVAHLLLNENSYRFDTPRAGAFAPRFGLRLWAKQRWMEVLVSPATDEVVVFGPNTDDQSVRSAKASVAPVRDALMMLLKEVPPEES